MLNWVVWRTQAAVRAHTSPSAMRAMVASRPSAEDRNSRTTPDRIISTPRQSESPDQIICPAS